MRLKLHEAVAEVRKERDAARKKAEEAEATCALLRTQANKMLEAAWKQVADAVNSKEAEKRVAHAEQCQAEAETKAVQLWQKVERLLSSLENAKRPAEDAGLALARGEQMRLQLQEALTEACKEKDSATKKVAVAKATCALLRVQENQVLEATQKWTVDAEHQAEAEAKLEDAERYRCAYKNLRKWIVHELWLQELQTNRKIYPQASEDIRNRGRRGCACPGISLGRALKVLDIIIDTFPSSMHTDPASMTDNPSATGTGGSERGLVLSSSPILGAPCCIYPA